MHTGKIILSYGLQEYAFHKEQHGESLSAKSQTREIYVFIYIHTNRWRGSYAEPKASLTIMKKHKQHEEWSILQQSLPSPALCMRPYSNRRWTETMPPSSPFSPSTLPNRNLGAGPHDAYSVAVGYFITEIFLCTRQIDRYLLSCMKSKRQQFPFRLFCGSEQEICSG